jgi:hypothetical protein
MAPDIRWDSSLLDEAAAILEAEWIRLQQDEAPPAVTESTAVSTPSTLADPGSGAAAVA